MRGDVKTVRTVAALSPRRCRTVAARLPLRLQIHFMDDARNQLHQFLRVPCERVAHWWILHGKDHAIRTHMGAAASHSVWLTPMIRQTALLLLQSAAVAARLSNVAGCQTGGNLTLARRRDYGFSAAAFKMMYG